MREVRVTRRIVTRILSTDAMIKKANAVVIKVIEARTKNENPRKEMIGSQLRNKNIARNMVMTGWVSKDAREYAIAGLAILFLDPVKVAPNDCSTLIKIRRQIALSVF